MPRSMRRPCNIVLAAAVALVAACAGGAGERLPTDERAEWRAWRASHRVTGPDGETTVVAGGARAAPMPGGGIDDDDHDDRNAIGQAGPTTVERSPSLGAAAAPPEQQPPPTGADSSERFTIVMSPPSTIDEKAHERTEVRMRQGTTLRVDGNPIGTKTTDRKVALEVDSRVVEITADGVPLVTEYVVLSATVDDGQGPQPLAARGERIVVRRKGPAPRIDVGGSGASGDVLEALELAFSTSDPGASNDKVLGSTSARAVGESWPIDATAAAVELSNGGKIRVDASQTSGESTLRAVRVCGGGTRCLSTRSEIRVARFELPGLPPDAAVRASSTVMRLDQEFPLLPRKATAHAALEMRARTVVAMQRDGRDVEIETVVHTVQHASSDPR